MVVSPVLNSMNTPVADIKPELSSINVRNVNINGVRGLIKVLLKCALLKSSSLFQFNTLSRPDCMKRILKKIPVKKGMSV